MTGLTGSLNKIGNKLENITNNGVIEFIHVGKIEMIWYGQVFKFVFLSDDFYDYIYINWSLFQKQIIHTIHNKQL